MRGDSSRALTGHSFFWGVTLLLTSTWLGCESIESIQDMYGASIPPVVLKESNLPLVMGPIPAEPRRSITDSDELSLDFRFDPRIVDRDRVSGFVLWLKHGQFGAWYRTTRYMVQDEKRLAGLKDGRYGLRGSVIYGSGVEDLVPRGDDQPLVWLTVDRTAPELHWVFPVEGGYCERGSLVMLSWSARELEFGDQHVIIEWTTDGDSWRTAGVVPAVNGVATLRWSIPSVDATSIVMRVSARDFLGHESEARVEIKLFGDVTLASSVGPAAPTEPRALPRAKEGGSVGGTGPVASPIVSVLEADETPAPRADSGDVVLTTPSVESHVEKNFESEALKGQEPEASSSLRFLNLDDEVTFRAGSSHHVFFLAEDVDRGSPVSLEWSESPTAEWELVGEGIPAGEGKVLWSVPKRTASSGRLRISATDHAGRRVETVSPLPIRVDSDAPSARIRAIRRDENGADVAYVSAYDRGPAGLASVTLFMTRNGGASWNKFGVVDPSAPISLPKTGGNVGLWVVARDAVGWETPAPQPGDKPQAVFRTGEREGLVLEDPEHEFLQGGSEYTLRWRFAPKVTASARLALEVSPSRDSEWELLDEVMIGSGSALIVLPDRDGDAYVFRGRSRLADGTLLESRSRRFAIDASPPQLVFDSLPERAGAALVFPLRIFDPGGSGVDGVFPYVRAVGTGPWIALPRERLTLRGGTATLSLQGLAEGSWELFLGAVDVAGNRLPVPSDASVKHGRFTIDRSPPRIRVKPTALPWVEGFDAVVAVEIDRDDAIPPLVLQSPRGEGRWVELHRWASFPPNGDLFRFKVPTGGGTFSGRFAVKDRVGNLSYAVMQPKTIERALELRSFNDGGEYVAGRNEPIEWRLHSALEELEQDLRVAVAYRKQDGQRTERSEKLSWRQVYDGLPVNGTCVWTVPESSSTLYELRLRLYLHGDVVSERVTTKPFRVVSTSSRRVSGSLHGSDPGSPLQTTRGANATSQQLAERAWSHLRLYSRKANELERWSARVTADLKRDSRTGAIRAEEWERVPQETRAQLSRDKSDLSKALDSVEQNFRRAIQIDEANVAATYGLAVVLLRHRTGSTSEAVKWLRMTLEHQGDHTDALNELGAALIQQHEYGQAAVVLEQAVAVVDEPEVRYNLALALFYKGRADEAQSHFVKALATGSSRLPTGELHYYLIMCLVKEGKRSEARAHFDRFRSTMPENLQATVSESL